MQTSPDYSDLNFLQRLWQDNRDNPDASNMMAALIISATPASPKSMRPGLGKTTAPEETTVVNEKSTEANNGNKEGEGANLPKRGVNNPNTKAASNLGNKLHYDQLNGGSGEGLPTELQSRYPNTQFKFTRRGEKGADVEVVGGTHPSKYPESTWDPNNNYGDFKPNTPSGNKKFKTETGNGKLPKNTQKLPYDPSSGKLQ